jgi:DNA-binding cell septation regulator SpoVG
VIEVIHFKKVEKNTLKGFISVKVPKWGDFVISDILYFQKDAQRWISFPSKTVEKDGEKKFYPYNHFKNSANMKLFQEKVFEALDKYLETQKSTEKQDEDFSF